MGDERHNTLLPLSGSALFRSVAIGLPIQTVQLLALLSKCLLRLFFNIQTRSKLFVLESLFGSPANPAVVAALIAGVTSIVVSLLAQFFNLFSGARLERLRAEMLQKIESTRAELSDLNSSRNARRDYEYDARKRLYAEISDPSFRLGVRARSLLGSTH
jgi:hypothetical protein